MFKCVIFNRDYITKNSNPQFLSLLGKIQCAIALPISRVTKETIFINLKYLESYHYSTITSCNIVRLKRPRGADVNLMFSDGRLTSVQNVTAVNVIHKVRIILKLPDNGCLRLLLYTKSGR